MLYSYCLLVLGCLIWPSVLLPGSGIPGKRSSSKRRHHCLGPGPNPRPQRRGELPLTNYPYPPDPPEPRDANRDGYPDNWDEIALAMKTWANWKCEHCGHKHEPETGYALTVHHLDGIRMNCSWRNLLVCCQRCHLHIQATYVPGQIILPVIPPEIWEFIRRPHATIPPTQCKVPML